MTTTAADYGFMAQALRLAERGLYTTDPNPRVGCVLVDHQGEVVGRGFHARAGGPHAEVVALAEAGEKARGATAYVTLEPCSHHGRTPPCADALIQAGVTRVIVAMTDPNPLVSGAGLKRLRSAGIVTESGVMQAEAGELNKGFVSRMTRGRPWIRVKLAMSLDGRTAMASGESRWITSDAARRDVQRLRARASAVLTGSATVLMDDPSMNVRLDPQRLGIEGEVRQPLRVVLDTHAQLKPSCKIFNMLGKSLIFSDGLADISPESFAGRDVDFCPIPANDKGLDLHEVARELAVRGVNECHVEAGPTLSGAFLEAGLVDELVVYMAPHVMGSSARGLFNLPGIDEMSQRKSLHLSEVRQLGPDLRLTLIPESKD
ncbi:MAG: bifunctional diaminohydroxyphosphoribosylaminopyrimidine deaminase/5-amino-6-(5-phosphoribosylamino)uracil reductase RibD [Thiotrichales bacterium]